MSPNLAIVSEGKKFMWDGQSYASREEALRVVETYQKDNFGVQVIEEDGRFRVYTRRLVQQVAAPPQVRQ